MKKADPSPSSTSQELLRHQLSDLKNRILVMLHEIKDSDKKRFEKELGEVSRRLHESETLHDDSQKKEVLQRILDDLEQTLRK